MLVNAIFAMPSLQWGPSHEISHLELFAGECSVTRGEFQDNSSRTILAEPRRVKSVLVNTQVDIPSAKQR